MENLEVVTQSKWKRDLKHDYFCSGSDTLVVMLPGYGYSVQKPIFYYLSDVVMKLDFDLLRVNYGFQLSQEDMSFEHELTVLRDEVVDVVSKVDAKVYKELIVIGKSIGTGFIDDVAKCLGTDKLKRIYLTPIDRTLPAEISSGMMIVYGDKDNLLSMENKNRIKGSTASVMVVEDANHTLKTGEMDKDLEAIATLAEQVSAFCTC